MLNSDTLILHNSTDKFTGQIKPEIKTVKDLIGLKNLSIPKYQRPYKWNTKHVKQLLEDIILHKDKSAYRMGTVVIYDKSKDESAEKVTSNYLHIVDGQQRLLSLTLIAYGLLNNEVTKKYAEKFISNDELTLLKTTFKSDISKNNVAINYDIIKREVVNFTEEEVYFFFNKCELVYIVLDDISEAFQFFDSQNDRGKGLDPHDLLKAFHLREMLNINETEKSAVIKDWEDREDSELVDLFGNYLFRVRRWSKRKQGRFLNTNNASIFKGITLQDSFNYPFAYPLRINHVFIEEFNAHSHRKIDFNKKTYPFQIDQVVINGKRFFEMVSFYQNLVSSIKNTNNVIYLKCKKGKKLKDENNNDIIDENDFLEKLQFLNIKSVDGIVFRIFKTLATYNGCKRTGDKYVRNLFDCALLYYIDKFGNKDLDKVVIKLFIWAYSLRLNSSAVQLASADNHAIERNSVFTVIREATQPKEVYNIDLNRVEENSIKMKIIELETLFKDLKYL
ncbi:DUF262 domain-containing protein [Oceanihabitans sediminis]|uniref:DUF262 domain-containing protein n=1 Tax=Oceanihabitans sediminis TaxID=1812012 RepID=UPI003A94BF1C